MIIISQNKKVFFDYFLEEFFEAGICLLGTEVKSLRNKECNIVGAHVIFKDSDLFLINFHISEYKNAFKNLNHNPMRAKKLLLKKHQISKLYGKVRQKNYAIIATKVYFNIKGKIKIELALGKGKKEHDKRQSIKEKDIKKREKYDTE